MSSPVYRIPESQPVHFGSRAFVSLLITANLAAYINPEKPRLGILLKTKAPWATLKEQYKLTPTKKRDIPRILPPREPEALMLSYPPMNYESDGRKRQRELWLGATRF